MNPVMVAAKELWPDLDVSKTSGCKQNVSIHNVKAKGLCSGYVGADARWGHASKDCGDRRLRLHVYRSYPR